MFQGVHSNQNASGIRAIVTSNNKNININNNCLNNKYILIDTSWITHIWKKSSINVTASCVSLHLLVGTLRLSEGRIYLHLVDDQ